MCKGVQFYLHLLKTKLKKQFHGNHYKYATINPNRIREIDRIFFLFSANTCISKHEKFRQIYITNRYADNLKNIYFSLFRIIGNYTYIFQIKFTQ